MIAGFVKIATACAFALLSAHAEAADTNQSHQAERALAITTEDHDLKWNDCPAFLPKGCGIAVLHGDPSKENVDVFFKVPAKSTIPLHWHSSNERMILVKGVLRLAYEGQKETVLKPGGYAFGPAKLPHKGYCESTTPCILFIAFESPVDAVPVDVK